MLYIRLLLIIFLSGCAAQKTNEYQQWASQPTPGIWKENSSWQILMLDKRGSIFRNLTVKFTDQAAETCGSGDFKKVEITSELPKRSELFLGIPAYHVKGGALVIDLSANLCDAGYELRGRLTDIGIEGHHQPVSMFGGEVAGRFYGSPLEEIKGSE